MTSHGVTGPRVVVVSLCVCGRARGFQSLRAARGRRPRALGAAHRQVEMAHYVACVRRASLHHSEGPCVIRRVTLSLPRALVPKMTCVRSASLDHSK
jgi:hypothetical protein